MITYVDLADAVDKAVLASKANPKQYISVMKRYDTGVFYVASQASEVKAADHFICQYLNGIYTK